MLRLRTLGGLWLEVDQGTLGNRAGRRRELALLALLGSASDAGITRDKLLAYLWPESETGRARNCLKQVLFTLHTELHPQIFLTTNPVVRLNPRAITADLLEFDAALHWRAFAEAVALYQGPFLDGFYVSGLAEFERWVEAERDRLASRYQQALESLAAGASEAGDTHHAVTWWRKIVAHDPLSSRNALGLMQALVRDGDRVEALKYAELHESLLHAELGVDPDSGEKRFVQQLREQLAGLRNRRQADRPGAPRRKRYGPIA